MADATTATAEKPKATVTMVKLRFKHKLILIIFCLVMVVFLRTGFVFFVIGMLPCIVAHYMDITKHRYTFRSIFAANLSGMLPFISRIIEQGPSSALLQETMGNAANWMIIYGAAFVGWLLVKLCPIVARQIVLGINRSQIKRYEWLQKKLESEWGPEVAQFSGENRFQQHT
jgi:hypothetical protein